MGFFSSVASGLKKVGRAVRSGVRQVVNIVKMVINRVVGIFDFVLGWIGILPRKTLRLLVVILHDESNSPLTTPNKVTPALGFAKSVFLEQANVSIHAARGAGIETLAYAAPAAALEHDCGFGAWKAEFGEAGDFFNGRTAQTLSGWLIGYAAPVTAFIVRNVRGDNKGCSLGPLVDYVTLDLDGLKDGDPDDDVAPPAKWLAHEIAHACGLYHDWYGSSNLMNPEDGSGVQLTRFQKAVLRNSRHVTYL